MHQKHLKYLKKRKEKENEYVLKDSEVAHRFHFLQANHIFHFDYK